MVVSIGIVWRAFIDRRGNAFKRCVLNGHSALV